MARTCAFCGKSIGFWEQEDLTCGSTSQIVCRECKKKYGALPMRERVEHLLNFGQPEDPQALRRYLATPEERARMDREGKKSGLTCLRCGGEMLKYGRRLFQVGEEGLLGPVFRDGFLASWEEMEILRCEKCGRAEFFLPNPSPDVQGQEMPEETVVCPVCGTEHSPLVGCPTCAVRNARTSSRTQAKGEKERKPPWEK